MADAAPLVSDPLPLLSDVYVRLFQVQWHAVRPDSWRMRGQRDSYWRMYCHDEAGVTIQSAKSHFELQPGRIYFVPAGVRFDGSSTRDLRQFYTHFDVLGLPGIIARELFDRIIGLPPEAYLQNAVQDLGRRIDTPGMPDLAFHLQLKSVIYAGLALHLQTVSAERIARCQALALALEPVQAALTHIEAHLAKPLVNRELAALCFMSESYFIRKFRETLGQTPNQFVREQRIKRAAQQLLFTDQSIDRIALQSGFGTRFYFTRVFAEQTGVGPAQYRKLSER